MINLTISSISVLRTLLLHPSMERVVRLRGTDHYKESCKGEDESYIYNQSVAQESCGDARLRVGWIYMGKDV